MWDRDVLIVCGEEVMGKGGVPSPFYEQREGDGGSFPGFESQPPDVKSEIGQQNQPGASTSV